MSHSPRRPTFRQGDANRTCVADGECRPRARSKKPTNHWCKGKVGIPHAWVWEDDVTWMGRWAHLPHEQRWRHQRRVCLGCGRQAFQRRVHCAICGSPERYREVKVPHAWRTYGPYCLCPDYYDPLAEQRHAWWSRPGVEFEDDPAQIARLKSGRRL